VRLLTRIDFYRIYNFWLLIEAQAAGSGFEPECFSLESSVISMLNVKWLLMSGLSLTVLTFASLYGMIQVFWDRAPHKLNYRLLARVFLDYRDDRVNSYLQNVGK
jgi:hypothetical protein